MRLGTGLAAAGLLFGLALVSGCSNGNGNSTGPPPGGNLELNSGDIGSGGTFKHKFNIAGTFGYHCTHHAMTGTVTVQSGAVATANVGISDNAYSPNSVTVGIGGEVTWTNGGGSAHTVTSH